MSTPIHALVSGSFTSDGAVKTISLPAGYDMIEMFNITDLSDANSTSVMQAFGTSSMSGGANYAIGNGGASVLAPKYTSTGGFTFISDSGTQTPEAALAVTSATNASPPVVTMTSSTGNVAAGDIVRYYGASGQYNISGMDFTAGTVVANTSIQLKYMTAPGAVGSGGSIRRIPYDARFYPRSRYIVSISKASSAVVVLSVTHGYTAGQKVRFIVPSAFGMTEMNNLQGTITAINTTTNSITVDIDSSAFTTFAFPSSATAAAGVNFAQVVPIGEAASSSYANLLDDATVNQSATQVQIGTTVQTSGKLYQWVARKGVVLS